MTWVKSHEERLRSDMEEANAHPNLISSDEYFTRNPTGWNLYLKRILLYVPERLEEYRDFVKPHEDRLRAASDAWRKFDFEAMFAERFKYFLNAPRISSDTPRTALRQAEETIESYAAARRRWVTGALDEQGSHLDASCPSQADALAGLAILKQEAMRELERVEEDGVKKIRETRDHYIDRILTYEVLHSPEFTVRGKRDLGKAEFEWTPQTGTETEVALGLPVAVANPPSDSDLGNIAVGYTYPLAPSGVTQPFVLNRKPRPNGAVVIKYRNDAGVAADPPHGRHRLLLTARNACGPSDLIVDIVRSKDLLPDPQFGTLAGDSPKWDVVNGNPTVVAGPTAGSTALRLVDNDNEQERMFTSQIFPIKKNATYRLRASARQLGGDRINYLFVQFRQDTGPLTIANFRDGEGKYIDRPNGWTGIGTFFYWKVMGKVFPADWTHYAFSFGLEGSGEIPKLATSFRVGAILCWSGKTESTVELTDYQVVEA